MNIFQLKSFYDFFLYRSWNIEIFNLRRFHYLGPSNHKFKTDSGHLSQVDIDVLVCLIRAIKSRLDKIWTRVFSWSISMLMAEFQLASVSTSFWCLKIKQKYWLKIQWSDTVNPDTEKPRHNENPHLNFAFSPKWHVQKYQTFNINNSTFESWFFANHCNKIIWIIKYDLITSCCSMQFICGAKVYMHEY